MSESYLPEPVYSSPTSSSISRDRGSSVASSSVRPASSHLAQPAQSPRSASDERSLVSRAAEMISETAHDLRAPLTTVRESVRLVRDGDAGEINSDQQLLLSSALDQCDCIDQMIGEMVQLDRLRSGTPRAARQWTPLESIQRSVDETLRPWAQPRRIDVLWDAASFAKRAVYADASMIRRLMVNLVVNGIRASVEDQSVLIRFGLTREGDALRCTVVDQGQGISESDLQRIGDPSISFSGSEGLGLNICRQLAAAHFSGLEIQSRLRHGTQVSFQLPCSGPRSVAIAWARWRDSIRMPLRKPARRAMEDSGEQSVRLGDQSIDQSTNRARVRMDGVPNTIQLGHNTTRPRFEDRFSAGVLTLGATVSHQSADQFDRILNNSMRIYDMAYRIDSRRWVWTMDAVGSALADRIDAINDAASNEMASVRTNWADPQIIAVDSRRAAARLSDMMVRESLAASSSVHFADQNDVRPGTEPIEKSSVASERLDNELRRLSQTLQSQTASLQKQSRKLRP